MENPVHSNKAETNSFQWLSAQSVSILPHLPIPTVKNCKRKEAEGHLCNLLQPDMSALITETLKNLHPAFKSLFREPLKGQLKSNRDHQTLQLFLKVSSGGWRVKGRTGKMEERETAARPRASKVVSSLNLSVPPVPLWNSNTGACLFAKHN